VALIAPLQSASEWVKGKLSLEGDGLAQKKRRRRLALFTLLGILFYSVFCGDQGLVALGLSWKETWALRREIGELQAANKDLAVKQAALARDRAYYEKMAREKLLLKNPGELIYRFDRN
jgi:cell division protein FtsB